MMRFMPRLPMRGIVFYRWTAFAPFALPVAGLLVAKPLALLGLPGAEAMATIFGFLLVAASLGGLPYLITAGIVLWRLRRATVDAHRRAAWVIPLPYTALLGVLGFAVSYAESGTGLLEAAGIAMTWALCGLGFGYAYVILIQSLFGRLSRKGVVCGDDRPPADRDG